MLRILEGIVTATPEARAVFAPEGRLLGEGDMLRNPELGDALERLGGDGRRAVLRAATSRAAIVAWVGERGGMLTAEDLAAYEVVAARAGPGAATAAARC